jgi:HAD superfamily phosphatase (TIGR01668 family)
MWRWRKVGKLRPAEYRRSIFSIDLDKLKKMGKRAIILDLDNTMVKWNHPDPTPAVLAWLVEVKQMGFAACIVSNNSGRRVSEFADKVDIPFIPKAVKPRRQGFRHAMQTLGVSPEETVVVGDQIFTDILGGNRAGAYTILVVPIDRREFIGTKPLRMVERLVLKYLHRQGLCIEE